VLGPPANAAELRGMSPLAKIKVNFFLTNAPPQGALKKWTTC